MAGILKMTFLLVVSLKMGFCLLIFSLTDEETRKIWEESGDPDGPGGKICVELLSLVKGFGNGKGGEHHVSEDTMGWILKILFRSKGS